MWDSLMGELAQSPGAAAAGGWLLGFLSKILLDRWSNKTLFDHRLRLEKEYALYMDLWDKLFELRRDLGAWIEDVDTAGPPQTVEDVKAQLNAYIAVVRRGQPFISPTIFEPSRRIESLARNIWDRCKNIRDIENIEATENSRRDRPVKHQSETLERLDRENEADFQTINALFDETCEAIQARVTLVRRPLRRNLEKWRGPNRANPQRALLQLTSQNLD